MDGAARTRQPGLSVICFVGGVSAFRNVPPSRCNQEHAGDAATSQCAGAAPGARLVAEEANNLQR